VTMLACNTYLQSIENIRQDLKLGCSGNVDKCNRPKTLYKSWFVNKVIAMQKCCFCAQFLMYFLSNLIFNNLEIMRSTKNLEIMQMRTFYAEGYLLSYKPIIKSVSCELFYT